MNHDQQAPDTLGAAQQAKRGGGHGFMMIACCIPMLVIAGVLVATGAVSPAFLLYAVGCTAMMAMMMRAMHSAGDDANEVPGRR